MITIYYQSKEAQQAAHVKLLRCDAAAEIFEDDSFPGVYGLTLPEALLREAYIDQPDIQFRAGWETGRASEPAFMDAWKHEFRRLFLGCLKPSEPEICLKSIEHIEISSEPWQINRISK